MKIENTFKFYLQFCIPFPSKPCVLALKSNDEIDSSACFETHVHFYTDMPLRTLRNYTGGLNNFVQNKGSLPPWSRRSHRFATFRMPMFGLHKQNHAKNSLVIQYLELCADYH